MRLLLAAFCQGFVLFMATTVASGQPTPDSKAAQATDPSADQTAIGKAKLADATAAALQWIVNHQMPNGSWSFEHRSGKCKGRCSGPGQAVQATNAATALALLPCLAAGQNHQRGSHQAAIGRGIKHLVAQGKVDGNGVSFLEGRGNMYSHGLVTFALCEAARQTKDKQLKQICQGALDYIAYAQDPVRGGWRYRPRQPGDTSVSGWQITALTSGQLAGLTVLDETTAGASRFLDSVQGNGGSNYGYTSPGLGRATTAIGLLSRMRLGGRRSDEGWNRGIDNLVKAGPSKDNLYFNFYATQAIAHRGGVSCEKWQTALNDVLLASQATEGHQAGSWHLGARHSVASGGRLYSTSMAAMMLAFDQAKLGAFQVETQDR